MSWLTATQVAAIGLFLLLPLAWPRRAQALLHRDLWVNVITGAGLFVVKWGLLSPLLVWEWGGGLALNRLPHPVLQGVVAFVALDLARYALHRVHHRVPLLWRFHRVHHSSPALDATSGLRMHVVDFVQLALLPALLFQGVFDTTGLHPAILPAVLLPGVVIDAFQHANLPFPLSHPLCAVWGAVLNNPHFHAWHHTRDADGCDGNYGNVLVIWDRLFGTEVTQTELPTAFGIPDAQALHNGPIGLQLLSPPHLSPVGVERA